MVFFNLKQEVNIIMKTYVLKIIIMFITIISFSCESRNIQPNIILVLVDDQGWTDSSVRMMKDREDSKSDFYETPNMERMANEGLVFSSAYAPAPVCTPTRYSILYGKTPTKLTS